MPSPQPPTGFRFAPVCAALVCAASTLAAATVAHAEPPRFLAEVERTQVAVGEPFIYEVTLSVGNDQVADYRPPDFKGLQVLSAPGAPNQSTQMQFGGAGMFVQVSYSWRYQLAAARKGAISIGPARVRVGGQEFRSSVVSVTASGAAAPSVASPSPQGTAPPATSPAATSPPSATSADSSPPAQPGAAAPAGALPPEASSGASFIRLTTDKQKVFVGEAITATWHLYVNQPADKYETLTEPQTEGFWTEEVQLPARRGGLLLTEEVVHGRNYQVATAHKKALFPLRPGSLTITPMEAQISRSDFFGNAVRAQRVRSLSSLVEVSPLPKAGQPPGFDAANVGAFTLSARVDRAQVAVGEAVALTIEVGGRGNLRKLALPAVPKLPGWKNYDPRVTVVVDPASGVTGTKTAEVLLLPERSGVATLPALVLDTFDPDSKRYVRAETAPITLTVTGEPATAGASPVGAGAAAGARPAAAGFAENVIADEIRPLHGRGRLRQDLGTTFFRTRGFTVAVALPPLGFALALTAFGLRDRLTKDTGSRRRRHARQRVRAHLVAAEGHRQRGELGPFFIEIDRVLREALASRLSRPTKGLRMDELRELLTRRGMAAANVDRVIALLEECDHARFAPRSAAVGPAGDTSALGATLDSASELIDVIDSAPLGSEKES